MGFVKLPSDLTEWAWVNDNNTLAVYVRLILGAAWKNRQYKNIRLDRGQIATTISQIAEQSDLTVQQVRTVLDRLKATGKITVERTSKFSIITLIEYDCDTGINSQDNTQTTDKQQSNNIQATNEQQTDNIQTTYEQQTNNTQTTDKQQSHLLNRNTERQIDRRTERENAPASETDAKSKKSKKPAPEKKHYAEFVTMTEEEYSKLVEKYGETATKWCIDKLDNYKGSSGKEYDSDYRTILSWVFKSYQEEQAKHGQLNNSRPLPKSGNKGTCYGHESSFDIDEVMRRARERYDGSGYVTESSFDANENIQQVIESYQDPQTDKEEDT